MTTTDALIADLASRTRAVPRLAAALWLACALIVGATLSVGLLTVTLGNPLLGLSEIEVANYGVKLAFTAGMTLVTARLLLHAGRPDAATTNAAMWIGVPVLLLALLALLGLTREPAEARLAYVMGFSWRQCLASVIAFSVPVFAALLVAFRRLAPTDLARAGTLAGLTAGATSAAVYALHCPETSPAFVLVWYGMGIGVAGLMGRAIGPRLLRW